MVIQAVFFTQGLEGAEIAVVKSNDIGPYNQAVAGFRSLINNLEEYNLKGDENKADVVIEAIRRSSPKLILAVGSLAASKLKDRFTDIPIICTVLLNVDAREFTAENVTCISIEIDPETQLKTLNTIVPKVKVVGVLYSKDTENMVTRIAQVCKKVGLELVPRLMEKPSDVPDGASYLISRVQSIWLIPDGMVVSKESLQYLLLVTLENRIPLLVYTPAFVKAGALLSLSVDYIHIGRQAAYTAQSILRGQELSDRFLPPTEKDLAVNLNTARRLGIKIPEDIIKQSKYVFE